MNKIKLLEDKLKEATLDPKTAMEVAGDLAINFLGKAHEKEDVLRVDVNKAKVEMKDANPKMPKSEVDMRVEASDLFLKYLRAKHATERIEDFIMIAKKHASIASGY